MFVTLYFETVDLEVTDIFAFKGNKCFTIRHTLDSFVKGIGSGRFTPVRIIYQRQTMYGGTELHVVDFTGRSFVLIDNSGNACRSIRKITDWIDDLDDRIPALTTEKTPHTYLVTPEEIIKRGLTECEEYFHAFVRSQVTPYFTPLILM